jgi:hypothetical protein
MAFLPKRTTTPKAPSSTATMRPAASTSGNVGSYNSGVSRIISAATSTSGQLNQDLIKRTISALHNETLLNKPWYTALGIPEPSIVSEVEQLIKEGKISRDNRAIHIPRIERNITLKKMRDRVLTDNPTAPDTDIPSLIALKALDRAKPRSLESVLKPQSGGEAPIVPIRSSEAAPAATKPRSESVAPKPVSPKRTTTPTSTLHRPAPVVHRPRPPKARPQSPTRAPPVSRDVAMQRFAEELAGSKLEPSQEVAVNAASETAVETQLAAARARRGVKRRPPPGAFRYIGPSGKHVPATTANKFIRLEPVPADPSKSTAATKAIQIAAQDKVVTAMRQDYKNRRNNTAESGRASNDIMEQRCLELLRLSTDNESAAIINEQIWKRLDPVEEKVRKACDAAEALYPPGFPHPSELGMRVLSRMIPAANLYEYVFDDIGEDMFADPISWNTWLYRDVPFSENAPNRRSIFMRSGSMANAIMREDELEWKTEARLWVYMSVKPVDWVDKNVKNLQPRARGDKKYTRVLSKYEINDSLSDRFVNNEIMLYHLHEVPFTKDPRRRMLVSIPDTLERGTIVDKTALQMAGRENIDTAANYILNAFSKSSFDNADVENAAASLRAHRTTAISSPNMTALIDFSQPEFSDIVNKDVAAGKGTFQAGVSSRVSPDVLLGISRGMRENARRAAEAAVVADEMMDIAEEEEAMEACMGIVPAIPASSTQQTTGLPMISDEELDVEDVDTAGALMESFLLDPSWKPSGSDNAEKRRNVLRQLAARQNEEALQTQRAGSPPPTQRAYQPLEEVVDTRKPIKSVRTAHDPSRIDKAAREEEEFNRLLMDEGEEENDEFGDDVAVRGIREVMQRTFKESNPPSNEAVNRRTRDVLKRLSPGRVTAALADNSKSGTPWFEALQIPLPRDVSKNKILLNRERAITMSVLAKIGSISTNEDGGSEAPVSAEERGERVSEYLKNRIAFRLKTTADANQLRLERMGRDVNEEVVVREAGEYVPKESDVPADSGLSGIPAPKEEVYQVAMKRIMDDAKRPVVNSPEAINNILAKFHFNILFLQGRLAEAERKLRAAPTDDSTESVQMRNALEEARKDNLKLLIRSKHNATMSLANYIVSLAEVVESLSHKRMVVIPLTEDNKLTSAPYYQPTFRELTVAVGERGRLSMAEGVNGNNEMIITLNPLVASDTTGPREEKSAAKTQLPSRQ